MRIVKRIGRNVILLRARCRLIARDRGNDYYFRGNSREIPPTTSWWFVVAALPRGNFPASYITVTRYVHVLFSRAVTTGRSERQSLGALGQTAGLHVLAPGHAGL